MIRRNISGIYIFDKFPKEEKRQPTCIEDCQPITRNEWLATLDKEGLISVVNQLCKSLTGLADFCNVSAE